MVLASPTTVNSAPDQAMSVSRRSVTTGGSISARSSSRGSSRGSALPLKRLPRVSSLTGPSREFTRDSSRTADYFKSILPSF